MNGLNPIKRLHVTSNSHAYQNKLCAWRHNIPPPLQFDNIFTFIRQVAPVPRGGYLRHQQQVDILTLKVVSESRMTWATSVPI